MSLALEEFQERVGKISDRSPDSWTGQSPFLENAPVDDLPIWDETMQRKSILIIFLKMIWTCVVTAIPSDECRVEMWRCLSRVVEGGLHYIDNPDGLNRLVKTTLIRATFQGRLDKILMGIPEVKRLDIKLN